MNGLPVSYDQYGQPFIILREQDRKKRVTGLEAQKVKKNENLKKKGKYFGSNHHREYIENLVRTKRYSSFSF
jgi:hypothetical protein